MCQQHLLLTANRQLATVGESHSHDLISPHPKQSILCRLACLAPDLCLTGQPPGSSRAPEPGYVLLITCPAAACRQGDGLQLVAEFSSSMRPLCSLLQDTIGPHWGSLPSIWHKAAAAAADDNGKHAGLAANSSGSGGRSRAEAGAELPQEARSRAASGGASSRQPGRLLMRQAPVMPAHGLQMASLTRSLACMQVWTHTVLFHQQHLACGSEAAESACLLAAPSRA